MTRTANARLAGFSFLFYIATGIASMLLFGRHVPAMQMRAVAMLSLLTIFAALTLAVTLYALTRDTDRDLALLAASCRVTEGALNGVPVIALLALADGVAEPAVANVLVKVQGWTALVSATVFAAGSAIFSYLFLRGRSIPVSMAWLGVIASVLLVAALPLQLFRLIEGKAAFAVWLPMLVFELALAVWLLIKRN